MKIQTYGLYNTEEKIPYLVKEGAYDYGAEENKMLTLSSPKEAAAFLNTTFKLRRRAEEFVYLICLNSKNQVVAVFEVSHGNVNSSFLSPREIFIRALMSGAVGIIVAHNHPSGVCTMSNEDKLVAERLEDAGKVIGINLIDFLVLGDRTYSRKANDVV